MLTGLYKVCGAWRSVRPAPPFSAGLEAAKSLLLFFVPKVPSRVRISKASEFIFIRNQDN
jgi:hypothetical protein